MTTNLDRIVRATITRNTRTVSRRSFGTIMLVGYHTAWLDRSRTYSDPDQMVTDGLPTDHPLVRAARTLASQSPRVPSWKVGRRAGAPTQTIRLTPTGVVEGAKYELTVTGPDGTTETYSYTAAALDDVAAVCTGLQAAIAAATLAITATDGATHVDVAADVAGTWFSYSEVSANIDLEDTTLEPATTLATDLAAIQAEDADWYGLIVVDAQSDAQITAIAVWAETKVVLHAAHTMDADVVAAPLTDIASTLKAASYFRTFPFWSRANHGAFPNAAILGAVFPLFGKTPADYEFKQLVGIVADDLDDTELDRLIGTTDSPVSGKHAMVYVEAVPTGTNSGTPITLGGLVSGGEWIDVIMGLDFHRALLQERAFNFRIAKPRVAFTAKGIEAFVGAVRSATKTAAAAPYEILDPDSLSFESTALEDVDPADRQARHYSGVQVNARVQGAIRALDVSVSVSP